MRRWFTLIEILLAIFVFSVGILAVLSLLTQNLRTMHGADVHRSAAFLAQESLSLLSHIRDSNVAYGIGRDCIPDVNIFYAQTQDVAESDVCDYRLSDLIADDKILLLWATTGSAIDIRVMDASEDFDTLFADVRLRTLSGSDILQYSNGEASVFARYLSITGATLSGQTIPWNILLKINSVVLFRQGDKTGQVVLETLLGN
jgi:prepilin-type N-terminal cleavage/methylation domain-containing protein